MNDYGYMVWKPRKNSKSALFVSNDGGKSFEKIAVFRNEETVDMFNDWLRNVLKEFADKLFTSSSDYIAERLTQMIGDTEDEAD